MNAYYHPTLKVLHIAKIHSPNANNLPGSTISTLVDKFQSIFWMLCRLEGGRLFMPFNFAVGIYSLASSF